MLLEAGHQLLVLDNHANSSPESLRRVQELVGPKASSRLQLLEGDIRSAADLERAFAAPPAAQPITVVIHVAGLKAVGESVAQPLAYWDVNVAGSRMLLAAMQAHGCRTLVFSSSATVYGLPEQVPIPETAPVRPINPYGHTKAAVGRRERLQVYGGDWPTADGTGVRDTIHVMDLSEGHPIRPEICM